MCEADADGGPSTAAISHSQARQARPPSLPLQNLLLHRSRVHTLHHHHRFCGWLFGCCNSLLSLSRWGFLLHRRCWFDNLGCLPAENKTTVLLKIVRHPLHTQGQSQQHAFIITLAAAFAFAGAFLTAISVSRDCDAIDRAKGNPPNPSPVAIFGKITIIDVVLLVCTKVYLHL